MYWLLGRNSELSVHNKLILYKQVIRPVWSYGIQLWGCLKFYIKYIILDIKEGNDNNGRLISDDIKICGNTS
jgi:hypothetical protein